VCQNAKGESVHGSDELQRFNVYCVTFHHKKRMDLKVHPTHVVLGALATNPALGRDMIADASIAPAEQVTMAWQAASLGNCEVLKHLLRVDGVDVNYRRQSDGVFPLYVAAQNGHADCVALLLKAGADVNQRRRTGATALFIAVQTNRLQITQCLLEHGADVCIENDQRCPPLILAANLGLTPLVQMLAESGADPSHRLTGRTALSWAIKERRHDTVDYLLQHMLRRQRQAIQDSTTRFALGKWQRWVPQSKRDRWDRVVQPQTSKIMEVTMHLTVSDLVGDLSYTPQFHVASLSSPCHSTNGGAPPKKPEEMSSLSLITLAADTSDRVAQATSALERTLAAVRRLPNDGLKLHAV